MLRPPARFAPAAPIAPGAPIGADGRPMTPPPLATVGGDPTRTLTREQVANAVYWTDHPDKMPPPPGMTPGGMAGGADAGGAAGLPNALQQMLANPPKTAEELNPGGGPLARWQAEHPFALSTQVPAQVMGFEQKYQQRNALFNAEQRDRWIAQNFQANAENERTTEREDRLAAQERARTGLLTVAGQPGNFTPAAADYVRASGGKVDDRVLAILNAPPPFQPGFTPAEDLGGPKGGQVFRQSDKSAQYIAPEGSKPQPESPLKKLLRERAEFQAAGDTDAVQHYDTVIGNMGKGVDWKSIFGDDGKEGSAGSNVPAEGAPAGAPAAPAAKAPGAAVAPSAGMRARQNGVVYEFDGKNWNPVK